MAGLGHFTNTAAQWCIHSAHEHDCLQRLSACNDYLLTRTIIYNDYHAPGPRHTHTNPPARMAPHPPPRIHTTEPLHEHVLGRSHLDVLPLVHAQSLALTPARTHTHLPTDTQIAATAATKQEGLHQDVASQLRGCTSAPDVDVPAPGLRTCDMDFVMDHT